jgi:hypothetical protein
MTVRSEFGPRLQNGNWTDIVEDKNTAGSGRWLYDFANTSVRHLASHECDILHIRQMHVGNELASPPKVASILFAQ